MSTQRKTEQALTPLELEIMQVLWAAGASTVSEVQPRLKAQLAYTTVQTMLNVLLRKNKVSCLPVVRDGKLVGIVTEHDFFEISAMLLELWLKGDR